MNVFDFLFGPTTFITSLLYILIIEGLIGAAWYAVWYETDKKKDWFIAHNTNTGRPHIFRAKPGQEGYEYRAGKEPVMVKLESHLSSGLTKRGMLWQFDSDNGQLIQRPSAREGTWRGLDGKWWLRFMKAEMESRVTSAASGNAELYRYLLIGAIVLLIPITVILWKVMGFGGAA